MISASASAIGRMPRIAAVVQTIVRCGRFRGTLREIGIRLPRSGGMHASSMAGRSFVRERIPSLRRWNAGFGTPTRSLAHTVSLRKPMPRTSRSFDYSTGMDWSTGPSTAHAAAAARRSIPCVPAHRSRSCDLQGCIPVTHEGIHGALSPRGLFAKESREDRVDDRTRRGVAVYRGANHRNVLQLEGIGDRDKRGRK